eukprot:jgi/Botrbrau1/6534/Bobra.40_2s0006.1
MAHLGDQSWVCRHWQPRNFFLMLIFIPSAYRHQKTQTSFTDPQGAELWGSPRGGGVAF